MEEMNLKLYAEWTRTVAVYPFNKRILYPAIGVINEIGEFAGKVKKQMRGDTDNMTDAMLAELGDVLWYVVRLLDDLGSDLDKNTVVTYDEGTAAIMNDPDFALIQCMTLVRYSGYIAESLAEHECDPIMLDRSQLEQLALSVYAILCVGAVAFGSSIEQLMVQNKAKLDGRKARGTLQGNGDNR